MNLKPKLSSRNPYKLEKHRYLELKHFCLQYPIWKEKLKESLEVVGSSTIQGEWSDETGNTAVKIADLNKNIELIEWTAEQADKDLAPYILKSVTEDIPFDKMKARDDIPAGRDMFYDRYRKFFSILHLKKGI